jgi:hypothetical protein
MNALQKISEEDLLYGEYGKETGQTLITEWENYTLILFSTGFVASIMLNVTMEISSSLQRSPYSNVRHQEIYKKQTGGRGRFADMILRLVLLYRSERLAVYQ